MTTIEWTDDTWNPVTGCSPVSAGCANCYAVGMTRRLARIAPTHKRYGGLVGIGKTHFNKKIRLNGDELQRPFRWHKPRMVFVCSMSDLFHPAVPFEFIDRVFAVMALTPHHTYQVLTKRPERMEEYLAGVWRVGHIWLGTSCEDQAAADERIPHLLRCPAAVRFVSLEPLLGHVDLTRLSYGAHRAVDCLSGDLLSIPDEDDDRDAGIYAAAPSAIDWVIVGGESGPQARPCNVEWIRDIVQQCKAAAVPCFVKQLGANPEEAGERIACAWGIRDPKGGDPAEWPADLRVREWPEVMRETQKL